MDVSKVCAVLSAVIIANADCKSNCVWDIILAMERINQDIKQGQFQNIYLLYGEEAYLRKYYKDALRKAVIGDDSMNYSYFEGKDTDPDAVVEMGQTMPFFGSRRLIVVENSGWAKSEGNSVLSMLEAMPDHLLIIFVESSIDKRTKFFKTCSKHGYACELKPLTGDKQRYWIVGILAKSGKRMRESDIAKLVTMTGDDMVNLQNELEKLINYVGQREIITAEDAEQIVNRRIEDHIFKLVDSMGRREQRKALEYYYELLALRESPFRILSLIGRQFNILLQTKELIELRIPEKQIAARIGVNPYFINNYVVQASNFDMTTIRKALEACVKADEDIKTGRMVDRLSVELLIVEYSK